MTIEAVTALVVALGSLAGTVLAIVRAVKTDRRLTAHQAEPDHTDRLPAPGG